MDGDLCRAFAIYALAMRHDRLGIQNAVGHPRVVQLPLAEGGRRAIRVDVIESGSAIVDNPTTGVVVDGELVYLARRNRESAFAPGAAAPGALEEIVVAAVSLTGD